jgi:ribosomal protein S18 acetylase RimI-like enzyme
MKTVIYRGTDIVLTMSPDDQDSRFRYVLWQPSFRDFVPPGKNRKYFFYWLFHYLGIFRNRDYQAVLVYEGTKLVSSLLIVPAHYKWPFMGNNDVQLTYVLTLSEYRGMGLAEKAIRFAIRKAGAKGRFFWYVTNVDNHTSIRLCKRVGFEFYSDAQRQGLLKIIKPFNSSTQAIR